MHYNFHESGTDMKLTKLTRTLYTNEILGILRLKRQRA